MHASVHEEKIQTNSTSDRGLGLITTYKYPCKVTARTSSCVRSPFVEERSSLDLWRYKREGLGSVEQLRPR